MKAETTSYLVRLAEERISSTALVDDIPDQVFLSIVCGQDADAISGITQQTHVHEKSHGVLRLSQVLHRKKKRNGIKTECTDRVLPSCCDRRKSDMLTETEIFKKIMHYSF